MTNYNEANQNGRSSSHNEGRTSSRYNEDVSSPRRTQNDDRSFRDRNDDRSYSGMNDGRRSDWDDQGRSRGQSVGMQQRYSQSGYGDQGHVYSQGYGNQGTYANQSNYDGRNRWFDPQRNLEDSGRNDRQDGDRDWDRGVGGFERYGSSYDQNRYAGGYGYAGQNQSRQSGGQYGQASYGQSQFGQSNYGSPVGQTHPQSWGQQGQYGGQQGQHGGQQGQNWGQQGQNWGQQGQYGGQQGQYSGQQGQNWGQQGQYGGQQGWQGSNQPFGQNQGFGQTGQMNQTSGFGSTSRGYGLDSNVQFGATSQVSHRGKGPAGYQRSDERIREQIHEILTDHDRIDASTIEVTVKDGEVTLSGTVNDRQTKRQAEEAIENVSGVKEVSNQLRMSAAGGKTRQASTTSNNFTDKTYTAENTETAKKHRA